jgi:hypothetical protein
MNEEQLICDFREKCLRWINVDDVVMGGVSRSKMKIDDGTAAFTGRLSLENSGGFASVRTVLEERDFSAFDGIRIRVKGDGRHYSFRIRNDDRFDGIVYASEFTTRQDEWMEFDLPFRGFRPVFRGRTIPDTPVLDARNIVQTGFLLSGKQLGPFSLQIEWIKAYREGTGVEPGLPE